MGALRRKKKPAIEGTPVEKKTKEKGKRQTPYLSRDIYSVIIAPLVTEKTSRLLPFGTHVFWVARWANKVEIKRAIEKLYQVKVQNVSSLTVKGRMKRVRWNQPGKTTSWKKAMVTLKKGYEIKLS